ncbi:hypothetical protein Tamer19_68640 [Cupriavidus sp. TA19]|nr:hypothetical protein Tamer19_68640 [Cupriavidus sp. TA19]
MVAGGDVGLDGMQAVSGYELHAGVVEHAVHYGYRSLWPGSLQQWQHGLADAAEADDDDLFDHADLYARNDERPGRAPGFIRSVWICQKWRRQYYSGQWLLPSMRASRVIAGGMTS